VNLKVFEPPRGHATIIVHDSGMWSPTTTETCTITRIELVAVIYRMRLAKRVSPRKSKSVYSNETGQVLYKVETPIKLPPRTSTISRVVPNNMSTDTEDMRDKFAYLATVKHKAIASSTLRFGGNEVETKEYFRKEGWSAHGRDRIFTGPDGHEYRWLLKSCFSELVANDEKRTPVAVFHRKNLGIIGEARTASLEIFPVGEHIVDMILITFIHIEKKRKDRE